VKIIARTYLSGILLLSFSLTTLEPHVFAQQRPASKAGVKAGVEDQDQSKQAEALFESGQQAHQTGDLAKAVELYTAALKLDPELWQAEYQRGVAWVSINQLIKAKDSMNRVLELLKQYPDSSDVRQIFSRVQITLGQIASTENNVAEAEGAFRRALELNPRASRAHTGLAELLLKLDKANEAIAEARAAIADGDDSSAAYSLLGESLSRNGAYDDAALNFTESLKRDPKNAFTLRQRAECLIAKKRLSEAVEDLRSSLAIDPLNQTRLRLASVYIQTKQYGDAIGIYQEILKADSSNLEARTALASVMIESGKGGDAIAQLEALIKSDPNRADVHAQLAELYLPTQPEKALEQYSLAAKLETGQPGHQIGKASALVKLRRFDEAVAILNQVLTQNPKDDIAYFAHSNLAVALFELDDFQNAAREFIRLLEYQRNRGDQKRAGITLYFLGICLDKLGDLEQALKAYQQFLAIASSDNQLEIDKVKLRLPSIQRQIKEGKGKPKPKQ
jgi:tetratricopeptide (TPR) repeat protein